VVQGVGFRPFVYRLATEQSLAGWVLNAGDGVEIHIEGASAGVDAFLDGLRLTPPPAAMIATVDVAPSAIAGHTDFVIRASAEAARPTTAIAADLAICDDCLRELFDPADPRYLYPYITCTHCGPRYSIIRGLPYDRAATTMAAWPLDARCARAFDDPGDRRFHAQPVACADCGPHYALRTADGVSVRRNAIARTAAALRGGMIVAIKGVGGFHLACDARDADAVDRLRARKFRKEKPFAVMARDLETARALAHVSAASAALLVHPSRPIVLMPSAIVLAGVAPDVDTIGVMLPSAPLHHLLFAAGAPDVVVMTSANRSSEPIAYRDADALERLAGIADAFLIGDRPIARRVDDSVVREGPTILRRARGYAPGSVATIPAAGAIIALGADLKNTVTLVIEGQAFMSQHLGDLDQLDAARAFHETVDDLLRLYAVRREDLVVVRDAHPATRATMPGARAVQHHRAHVASVLAERGAWSRRVIGLACDGTGYGDDGTIWGGELFAGSVATGFDRVGHLRQAALVGGDAAAASPVQSAAGFVDEEEEWDMTASPFDFPARYAAARRVRASGTRTFRTTSVGRLFDAVAALVGFTRPVTFEGQAAIWLEQRAHRAGWVAPYPFPFVGGELDYRPLIGAVVRDRRRGRSSEEIARAFHAGLAWGFRDAIVALAERHDAATVVASGGVLQNAMLLDELGTLLRAASLELWVNHVVPPNDGGISLGQAALAAFGHAATPLAGAAI
jgi:hydrogenase maturation protein HypF